MHSDTETTSRSIPSLVQVCQRVIATNVDRISSLGEDLPAELLKPILPYCSAHTLLRFEKANPLLASETSDTWKNLCYRCYPLQAEQRNAHQEPESWRDEFFVLRDLEAKRLEEVGSRLRSQREEAEQRKKETQIKLTDKVPPQKRFRGSWGPTPQKTLLQKTRSDAAKIQKGFYGMRMIPPMPTAKTLRVLPGAPSAKMSSASLRPSASSSPTGTRVTVTAVPVRQPPIKSPSKTSLAKVHTPTKFTTSSPSAPSSVPPTHSSIHSGQNLIPKCTTPSETPSSHADHLNSIKPPVPKKNPMNSLFVPKHRAHSQLPVRGTTIKSKT